MEQSETIISAHRIRSKHYQFRCRLCGEDKQGEHVQALGKAIWGQKAFWVKVCTDCALTLEDEKIRKCVRHILGKADEDK